MALRTGRVIIAKNIKLDKDYNDVLTYSESDMLNLVIQNKIAETSNCSFIKVGENIGYSTGNQYVPAESMEIINNIFRRGVTLWHNHANLGDYSVTNNIIS